MGNMCPSQALPLLLLPKLHVPSLHCNPIPRATSSIVSRSAAASIVSSASQPPWRNNIPLPFLCGLMTRTSKASSFNGDVSILSLYL
nr:hypothetical protein Iba_chr11fCG4210 [Ipomoea batatas]